MEATAKEKKEKPSALKELEEFKKRHSEAFLFFLEEYDKWRQLKQAELALI